MKTFEHEWILEAFVEHPTFFTTRMFGGLAAYLFERQMLLLVEPTKSGRWKWAGQRLRRPNLGAFTVQTGRPQNFRMTECGSLAKESGV